MKKKFALIGAAGYIAPRHMQAIKDVGGELVVVCDKNDSVGILDSYFPKVEFFTSHVPFLDYCERQEIDYLVICTPNHQHAGCIKLGLMNHMDIICEKPLYINPQQYDILKDFETRYDKKVYSILQMRYHPVVEKIKQKVIQPNIPIQIIYHTYRGPWYNKSWKMDKIYSGGLAYNIGIHLFDLAIYLFGKPTAHQIKHHGLRVLEGMLAFENNDLHFDLDITKNIIERALIIDHQRFEFSYGFENLHTKCYEEILAGRGFGFDDAKPALDLCWRIENEQNG